MVLPVLPSGNHRKSDTSSCISWGQSFSPLLSYLPLFTLNKPKGFAEKLLRNKLNLFLLMCIYELLKTSNFNHLKLMWILEKILLGRSGMKKGIIYIISSVTIFISCLCLFALIHAFLCHPPVWVIPGGGEYWWGVLGFPWQCPGQPRQAGRGAQADRQIRRPAGCWSWKCSKWIFIHLYQPWNTEGVFRV